MKTTTRVLELLSSTSTYLSGQQIADQLQLSRTAVWKAIKALQDKGYAIKSKAHVGYCYVDDNTLNETLINQNLNNSLDLDILLYDSLPSTNLKAKELSLDPTLKRPVVLIADQQTAGYGRYQRSFLSPKKTGIYLSILLDNDQVDFDPGLLTTATAIAVTRTLEKLFPITPSIKWVNDVLVDGKKICGILTEGIADLETQTLNQIVVGTGINFATPMTAFPPELHQRIGSLAPYLAKTSVSRNQFIAEYLNQFFDIYQNYATGNFMPEYRAHCELIGKQVTIEQGQKQFNAKVSDINDHGALVLADGRILSSGEITKIRKE